jgi:hypothetical protein
LTAQRREEVDRVNQGVPGAVAQHADLCGLLLRRHPVRQLLYNLLHSILQPQQMLHLLLYDCRPDALYRGQEAVIKRELITKMSSQD